MRAPPISPVLGFWLLIAGSTLGNESVEPQRAFYPFQTMVCPDALLRACCDYYCRKPLPCIPCFVNGCGVAYCPKPLPCIPCYVGGCTADCYCPKPFPNLCRPIMSDYFRCVSERDKCTHAEQNDAYAHGPSAVSPVAYPDGGVINQSPVSSQ
jgi:hypothetical protein